MMLSESDEKSTQSLHVDMAEAFNHLASGLADFLNTQMSAYLEDDSWTSAASAKLGRPSEHGASDPYFQLLVLNRFWGPVFAEHYGQDLRPIINDLIETRNLWAHFALPSNIDKLDLAVLSMERLLAPVNADAAVAVRGVRLKLKKPRASNTPAPQPEETAELQTQFDETEYFFEELKETNSKLSGELSQSRRISANKQLKLAALENQLSIIQGKSIALESYLNDQQKRQTRVQWLFICLLATTILVITVAVR